MYTNGMTLAEFRFATLDELAIEAMAHSLLQDQDRLSCDAAYADDAQAAVEALRLYDKYYAAGTLDQARALVLERLPAPKFATPAVSKDQIERLEKVDALLGSKDAVHVDLFDALSDWNVPQAAPILDAVPKPPRPRGAPRKTPPWRDSHDDLCLMRDLILKGLPKYTAASLVVENKAVKTAAVASAASNLVTRYDARMALRDGKIQ